MDEKQDYLVKEKPYYEPVGDEIDIFKRAHAQKQHIAITGPTGVGKTRFLEYMAYELHLPFLRVICTEDTDASELLGLNTIQGWVDGPVLKMVDIGGLCYLDEVIEARKDVAVIMHSLTDTSRSLYVPKRGKYFHAPDDFMLVTSYNPNYQSIAKDLKPSTKQRFITLNFDYPPEDLERKIIMQEGGVDDSMANALVKFGKITRNLKKSGQLIEGAGTRLLVLAAQQIKEGTSPKRACEVAVIQPLTYDPDVINSLRTEHLDLVFGKND